jgi:hypothetical protein
MKAILRILCLLVLFSCKGEPETGLTILVNSELDASIVLVRSSNGNALLDTVYTFSGSSSQFKESYNLEGGSDSYPISIHRTFLNSDTIILAFQDTIPIKHINRHWLEPLPNLDSTSLYLDNPRNIYNSDNFEKTKTGDRQYRGVYHITQGDLDYAIEVN